MLPWENVYSLTSEEVLYPEGNGVKSAKHGNLDYKLHTCTSNFYKCIVDDVCFPMMCHFILLHVFWHSDHDLDLSKLKGHMRKCNYNDTPNLLAILCWHHISYIIHCTCWHHKFHHHGSGTHCYIIHCTCWHHKCHHHGSGTQCYIIHCTCWHHKFHHHGSGTQCYIIPCSCWCLASDCSHYWLMTI